MKKPFIYILISIFLLSPLVQAHAACNENSQDILSMENMLLMDNVQHQASCHDEKTAAQHESISACDFTCALGIGIPITALAVFSDSKPPALEELPSLNSLHSAFSDSLYRPPA